MKKLKLLVIVAIALLLCGCSLKKEDDKKCIGGHTETRIIYVPSGNGQLRMQIIPQYVCDKWEE